VTAPSIFRPIPSSLSRPQAACLGFIQPMNVTYSLCSIELLWLTDTFVYGRVIPDRCAFSTLHIYNIILQGESLSSEFTKIKFFLLQFDEKKFSIFA